jgi:Ca-activated chloride channel family protein
MKSPNSLTNSNINLSLFRLATVITTALLVMAAGCSVPPEPNAAGDSRQPAEVSASDTDQNRSEIKNSQVEPQAIEADTLASESRDQSSVADAAVAGRSYKRENLQALSMSAMQPGTVMEEFAYCCRHDIRAPSEPLDRENYEHLLENPIRLTSEHPVSTFSIDVDTGSYSNVRRFLNAGNLPPEDAVRVEELINYFSYDYAVPGDSDTPFSISTEVAKAPWNEDKLLMQIGIKGYEVAGEERPSANLVFLVDVSGSMGSEDKLPLLKKSLQMLARQLTADDRVSLVVYAGASGVVLEPTPGDQQAKILGALDRLSSGGSTNGASGIRLAYQMAQQGFNRNGINRVMLATDGDFNVGTVDFDALIDLVERKRVGGVSLTTLGFGTGNYNDHLMEQLADAGNGNYAYIDTLNEGRKVLVDQMGSTLQTIAKDVKIQVEFDPAVVAEYRLIGYENRILRREDFNNDKIDAGEIGAGHTVTALYELALVDSPARLVDPLRYGNAGEIRKSRGAEIAFVRLRYKAPDGDVSKLIEHPISRDEIKSVALTSSEMRFATAVAAFGQLLKGGDYLGAYDFADVIDLASHSRGEDLYGYRSEFLGLARLADSLSEGASDRQARR